MEFHFKNALTCIPMAHITALSDSEKQLYKPELPDSAKDQMTLKITVGDRRVLEKRASAARQSPTQFLVGLIHSVPARVGKHMKPAQGEISFLVDQRREVAAEQLAKNLGFHEVEHLAKDLLYSALNDPEMAEEFLFGKLRKRIEQEAREELEQQQSSKSKRAA